MKQRLRGTFGSLLNEGKTSYEKPKFLQLQPIIRSNLTRLTSSIGTCTHVTRPRTFDCPALQRNIDSTHCVRIDDAIAFQLVLFTLSLIKFGKLPSFHTYIAKAWGIALVVAVVGLSGYDWTAGLWGAIVLCVINSIEEHDLGVPRMAARCSQSGSCTEVEGCAATGYFSAT